MKVRNQHHGRTKWVFFWFLFTFFTGQAVLSPVIDYLTPEYRFPWFYRLVEIASQLRDNDSIVCLGSSRFGTGLFAGEMTPMLRQATGDQQVVVMNASVPGGDFITSERMLNQLLDQGLKPRLILLEFCPDILNQQIGWMSMHTMRTLNWHDLKEYRQEYTSWTEIKRFLICKLFPLYQYRHSIRGRMGDRWLPVLKGNREFQVPAEALSALTDHHWTVELSQPAWPLANQLREITPHFEKYQIGGKPVACLRRMVERCQKEQIPIVLIEPPVNQVHQKFYTLEVDRQFQQFAEMLCAEYHLPRYSYRQALPEEAFHDHHHSNRRGAQKWSELVTQEILIPAWTRKTGTKR